MSNVDPINQPSRLLNKRRVEVRSDVDPITQQPDTEHIARYRHRDRQEHIAPCPPCSRMETGQIDMMV